MKSITLRTSLIGFLCGIVLASSFFCLFIGCGNAEPVADNAPVPASEIKTQAEAGTKKYQEAINYLEKENQRKEDIVTKAKNELKQARLVAKQLEVKLKQRDETYFEIPVTNNTGVVNSGNDSSLNQLIAAGRIKDSLCDAVITGLEQVVAGKDSLIAEHIKHTNDLQQSLTLSLSSQQVLEKQNHIYKKQIRKHRFLSKLKSLGIVIGSGLTAGYIIQHH